MTWLGSFEMKPKTFCNIWRHGHMVDKIKRWSKKKNSEHLYSEIEVEDGEDVVRAHVFSLVNEVWRVLLNPDEQFSKVRIWQAMGYLSKSCLQMKKKVL
ncbi:hypothetical protein GOBAR_AA01199 [Gossypium barbadense]|uniref:Uncharacterized protein n=1 Tax=Gossypium barbadense TaxID=3634 RepID=A0A2P5YUX2_GOSBA|nr:hypothetical protein GOBAR_AA01199 [Gossypium barbadense]